MAYFALRPELIFDQLADVKSVNQSMPGSSVVFTIQNDLAAATAPLSEGADVTTQTLSNSQISVSLAEYGAAVTTTAVLRGESYVEIDPIVANVIGYNAGVSIDSVARNALGNGTQFKVASGASIGATKSATIANVSALTANALATYQDILAAQKNLRAQNVSPFGSYYAAVIHPDVAYDIQTQSSGTTGGSYLAPHQYAQPAEIWAGEIGALNGFRFIETPRAQVYGGTSDANSIPLTLNADIAAGTFTTIVLKIGANVAADNPLSFPVGTKIQVTDSASPKNSNLLTVATAAQVLSGTTVTLTVSSYVVATGGLATATSTVTVVSEPGGPLLNSPVYGTYFMGRQSLAKVHSIVDGNGPVPKIIPGPITDTLRRYVPLGWYWLGGYSVFRQPAVMQYFTQSSLTNIDPAIDN